MKRWTFAVAYFRASSSGSGQPQLQSTKGHGNVHDVLRSPGQEDIRRLSQWILTGNIGVGKTIISHPRNHHKSAHTALAVKACLLGVHTATLNAQ